MDISNNNNNRIRLGILFCVGVVFLSSFIFLFRLGKEVFVDYDEAIYAQIMDTMNTTGDYLTLRTAPDNGPFFEKPPLYFWEVSTVQKVFDSPEFAMRLPSALAGIVTVILVMLIMYELTGNLYVAGLAGLILVLTGSFVEASRQLRLDSTVTMTIVFGVYSFLRAQKNPKWYIGIGISTLLGIMTKSVIGLLIFPYIILWSLFNNFRWIKNKFFWLGIVCMVILVLPWHIYEYNKFGSEFLNLYLLHTIFERFSDSVISYNKTSNLDYVRYLQFAIPWIFVFVLGIKKVWGERKDEVNKNFFIFSLFAIFIYAIFNFSHTKLVYYIVPILPFIALSCGYILYEWLQYLYNKNKSLMWLALIILTLAGLANTIYVAFHFQKNLSVNKQIATEEKQVGLILLEKPRAENIYAYQYLYWDTIKYYSRRRLISLMQEDQILDKPFFLLMSRAIRESSSFPEELEKHFSTLFQGIAVVLLEFKP